MPPRPCGRTGAQPERSTSPRGTRIGLACAARPCLRRWCGGFPRWRLSWPLSSPPPERGSPPAGAYLRVLRWPGVEWQIDCYAANASRLVAQLGEAPEFKEVRFLSATTRVNLADRTYESFVLAFRYAPAPEP